MTATVALIGHPLRRRHSEVMHNAAFAHFGIDAVYELRDLEPEQVGGFVDEVRDGDWLGFQITAPYKQVVMEHLDEIEAGASRIGAVNSVASDPERGLVGFNTDAPGFRRAIESELDVEVPGLRAAVAGAGGAARAVVDALVDGGAISVTVGNRTVSRARSLAADFGTAVTGVELGDDFDAALADAGLAVNATTVGMHSPGAAFSVDALGASAAVYDLVYEPPEPPLLAAARARGLRTANGLGMLVAQAEIAFERWTGVANAGPVMRAALGA